MPFLSTSVTMLITSKIYLAGVWVPAIRPDLQVDFNSFQNCLVAQRHLKKYEDTGFVRIQCFPDGKPITSLPRSNVLFVVSKVYGDPKSTPLKPSGYLFDAHENATAVGCSIEQDFYRRDHADIETFCFTK